MGVSLYFQSSLLLRGQLGGDTVYDMLRHGPTTQYNQGEPNVSFFVQTPEVIIRLSNTHQTTNPLIVRPLSEKSLLCKVIIQA